MSEDSVLVGIASLIRKQEGNTLQALEAASKRLNEQSKTGMPYADELRDVADWLANVRLELCSDGKLGQYLAELSESDTSKA